MKQPIRKRLSVLLALFMAVGLLQPGTVYARAEGGDTTPPAFEADYPKEVPQGPGSRQVGILIKTQVQEEAYYYLILQPNNTAAPSKEQVVAGKDGNGNPALKTQNSGSNKYKDIQTGTSVPEHGTAYDVYVVLKDDAGNLSEPAKLDVTSPPPANLIVGDGLSCTEGAPGSRQLQVSIQLQNIDADRKGKVYWVLLPKDAAAPSIEQIAGGTDGNGTAAINAGSPEFSPGGTGTFNVTGEVGGTAYDLYLVVGDTRYASPLSNCTGVQHLAVTTPADIPGEMVCEIVGGSQYGTLEEALSEAASGSEVKLLKSFTSIHGISISNKIITFNLNGHTLNITTTANEGLKVIEGTVALTGEGQLNISGKLYGVWANKGTITVTNATATDTDISGAAAGTGVFAMGASKVTVRGNAVGAAHGVKATDLFTEVTVNGDVSNTGQIHGAVYSAGQAAVLVKGSVSSTQGYGVHTYCGSVTVNQNVSGGHVGAMAEDTASEIYIKGNLSSGNNGAVISSGNGSITVDGEITGYGINPNPSVSYVTIGTKKLAKTDGIPDPAKPAYLKYSDSGSVTGAVWVKVPGGPTGTALWHHRAPNPSPNFTRNVKYLNGQYMAVGNHGTLLTSPDGESWQKTTVGQGIDTLGGIAYGAGKYVLAGHVDYMAGRIFTSDDGVSWHETAAVPHHNFSDVAFGNGTFVAVGGAGKMLTSADGETWVTNPVTYPEGNRTSLLSITFAAGKFVAVGMRSDTGQVYRGSIMTSEDGVHWQVTYANAAYTLWDVAYGNGLFVAVGGMNTGPCFIATSGDGVTWTQATGASAYADLFSIEYDGTQFIAAGKTHSGSNAITTVSGNGANWTDKPIGILPGLQAVASDGAKLVAMSGYGNIYLSADAGTSWGYCTGGSTQTLQDVAYNGSNLYVAVGLKGTIQTSPDGRDWTIQTSGTANDLNKVDYLDGQFIAVGKAGTILTSPDGVIWTAQTTGVTQELKGLTYGEGRYVVVGGSSDSSPVMLYSTDGVTWTSEDMTGIISRSFVSVAYGDGAFLAVMQYGQAYRYTWNAEADKFDHTRVADLAGSGCYPKDIIWGGETFAAVGGYGEVYLSSDKGGSWTLVDTDLDSYSLGIAYGGGNLIAVGELGKVMASADGGMTWRLQPSGLTQNHYSSDNYIRLNGVVAGDDCFVAVGENGLVLQSESFTVSADADLNDVEVAKRALYYGNIAGSGQNDSPGRVVASMNLITTWSRDTTVTWASNKPQYVAPDGTVTRPAFGSGDQVVCLTATISKGTNSATKSFLVVVLQAENPDIGAVSAAAAALTFGTIKNANTAANQIVSDLSLPTAGLNDTSITWQSDKLAVITAGGAVTRPSQGAADVDVVLTATIAKGIASQTKTFYLTVKAMADQDALDVAAAVSALTFNTIRGSNIEAERITANLSLPATGANGTAITWQSSKPAYLTAAGTVTRPAPGASDEDTILTATISKGTASQNKQFTVRVKALPPTPGGNSGSSGETALPSVSYKADITGSGTVNVLPVSHDVKTGRALVVTGAQQGDSVMSGGSVMIDMPSIPDVGSFTLEILADYLSGSDGKGTLILATDLGSVTMPSDMLANTPGGKAQITIGRGNPKSLSEELRAELGNRPLIQLSLALDGKQTDWNNPKAPVTVSIPYTPTAEELAHPESIVIWYIDGSGNATCVPNGHYDPLSGTITFVSTHFSDYAVAYSRQSFDDVPEDAWYHKAVSFIAARDITRGTGSGAFTPNAKLTRGEFVVLMMRAYGIAPDIAPGDNFEDAGNTYYTGYLAAAKRSGISTGVGNNQFAPGKEITRQEMATLLYNALKAIDQLPNRDSGKTLQQFSDAGQIDAWAKDAMTLLVKTGTFGGSNGALAPQDTATRAELAQVLCNLLEE